MIYRVDESIEKDMWVIIADNPNLNKWFNPKLDIVFQDAIVIANVVTKVRSVYVEGPTQLAALSHALILFNGENITK